MNSRDKSYNSSSGWKRKKDGKAAEITPGWSIEKNHHHHHYHIALDMLRSIQSFANEENIHLDDHITIYDFPV